MLNCLILRSKNFSNNSSVISVLVSAITSPLSESIIDFAIFLPIKASCSTTMDLIPAFSISLICFTVMRLSLVIIILPFLSLISRLAISPLCLSGMKWKWKAFDLISKVSKS